MFTIDTLLSKVISLGLSLAIILGAMWYYGNTRYVDGQADIQAKWDKELQRQKENSHKISVGVITKYVDRIKVIHEKGDTIIKKVPVYVTRKDDSKCTVNRGFVSLWNSSNKGLLPATSRTVNAEPSAVKLSDIASQHSREVGICKVTEQTLVSLQAWVREEYKAVNGHPLEYHKTE